MKPLIQRLKFPPGTEVFEICPHLIVSRGVNGWGYTVAEPHRRMAASLAAYTTKEHAISGSSHRCSAKPADQKG